MAFKQRYIIRQLISSKYNEARIKLLILHYEKAHNYYN